MRMEETRGRLIAETNEHVNRLGAPSASNGRSATLRSRFRYFAETTAILELVAGSAIGIGTVLFIVAASSW